MNIKKILLYYIITVCGKGGGYYIRVVDIKLLYSYPPPHKYKHNVIFSYHYICKFYKNIYNNIERVVDMVDMVDIFINSY